MKKIYVALFLLCLSSPAFGQLNLSTNNPLESKNPTIKVGEFLTADTAILSPREDGRVDVFVSNLDEFSRFVATIDVPYKSPIVRAFEADANRFSPVPLTPSKTSGKFTLDKPGTWIIEIWGIDNGAMTNHIFNDVVIPESSKTEPAPPEDPPIAPVPEMDFPDLTDLTLSMLNIVDSREETKRYLSALEKVDFSGSLSEVITKVSDVRKRTLTGPVKGKWYKLFQSLDSEFSGVETIEGYTARWDAVIEGMRVYLESNDSAPLSINPMKTFPVAPYVNQIHGRYQYQRTNCADGTCTFNWILVK